MLSISLGPLALPVAPALLLGAAWAAALLAERLARRSPLVQAVAVSRARLAFTRSANELNLSWAQGGYVLQENSDLTKADGWTDTQGGGASPVTVPIANAGGKFYRLHKP